jgi:hypothetical protein
VLTFATKNSPVYTIKYNIEQIAYKYNFLLNSITCIKQTNWFAEELFAEVEFNYHVNNVNSQPTNKYFLGYFQKNESSFSFSSHHCKINLI